MSLHLGGFRFCSLRPWCCMNIELNNLLKSSVGRLLPLPCFSNKIIGQMTGGVKISIQISLARFGRPVKATRHEASFPDHIGAREAAKSFPMSQYYVFFNDSAWRPAKANSKSAFPPRSPTKRWQRSSLQPAFAEPYRSRPVHSGLRKQRGQARAFCPERV